jgi:predicted metal-binding transcription factor (methanogenesis marker protein 9)
LRIVLALQQGTNSKTLRESFRATGIFPLDTDQMISNCKVTVPDVERAHWMNQLDIAKDEMINKGELSDEFLDSINIANNTNKIKDHLTVSRRRQIFLTNETFLEREKAKLESKNRKTEPKQTPK